jgi:hypothetical protein
MDKFWLKAAGDNAFVEKEAERETRGELVKRLKASVREALVSFATRDAQEVPLTETLALAGTVEAVFQWGWKNERTMTISELIAVQQSLR